MSHLLVPSLSCIKIFALREVVGRWEVGEDSGPFICTLKRPLLSIRVLRPDDDDKSFYYYLLKKSGQIPLYFALQGHKVIERTAWCIFPDSWCIGIAQEMCDSFTIGTCLLRYMRVTPFSSLRSISECV